MNTTPHVGDRVRIQRDETKYPSKGTWPQFRGRTGTIVEINLGEYGVVFGKVSPRRDRPGKFNHGDIVTWFQRHEIVREPVSVAVRPTNTPRADR